MLKTIKAATAYFGVVFAFGFPLGTARVLAIAPLLGERLAVVAELPVILVISWITCRFIVDRFSVPMTITPRLAMGGVAFIPLMAAEMGVLLLAFGRTSGQHSETYQTAPAILGLLGQIMFALLPVVQLRSGNSRR